MWKIISRTNMLQHQVIQHLNIPNIKLQKSSCHKKQEEKSFLLFQQGLSALLLCKRCVALSNNCRAAEQIGRGLTNRKDLKVGVGMKLYKYYIKVSECHANRIRINQLPSLGPIHLPISIFPLPSLLLETVDPCTLTKCFLKLIWKKRIT